jgi:16S rRNA G966 N2-methylase RsmD
MATDINAIIKNLLGFYNFDDKIVISVGAGGGQLIEYGRAAKKVIALDNNATAIQKLRENLINRNLEQTFEVMEANFYKIHLKGDVVFFEFCLHEMPEPAKAIKHALTMASQVLIMDHDPQSKWAYYAAEDHKVSASWKALEAFDIKKRQLFTANQVFQDHNELYEKLKSQSEESIKRISEFSSMKNIIIPMPYGTALI